MDPNAGTDRAGLVRNHYCESTISLAEDWWRGGFGTGGQGSDVTPCLVSMLLIEHVLLPKIGISRSTRDGVVWAECRKRNPFCHEDPR